MDITSVAGPKSRHYSGVVESPASDSAVSNGPSRSNLLPRVSSPLLAWFTWYSRRYLRRHFHSLRVSSRGLPPAANGLPLVIYLNHASWWDALVCLLLKAGFYPNRSAFAPIDAAMLTRYKFFRRLGFFGVEQQMGRGAFQFFRIAAAVLESPQNLLVITPQSRFADVRERPVGFAPGLGQLASLGQRALFVPLAIEYVFWEERLPEILVRFGEPVEIQIPCQGPSDAKSWTSLFEENLTATQDTLAAEAQRRCPSEFEMVIRGGAGQGGVYDWWQSIKAKWHGETFRKEHGDK